MQLYRQVRPTDFDQMVGSKDAIESLHKLLTRPEGFPDVVGLFGPSGCGKTTMARIAAKKYLGATEMTISELNLSEARGIDTAREIQGQMEYLPPGGGHRVFILDECHKATPEFWNAMLKPLEDVPKHVAFFLCTSEPKGIKNPAIHTRLTAITVSLLTRAEMTKLVLTTNKEQGLGFSRELLDLVIAAADGAPRKALVYMDQLRGVTEISVAEKLLQNPVGNSAATIDLCRALVNGASWGEVAPILVSLKEAGEDPEKIRRAVSGYCQAVLLKGSFRGRAGAVLETFLSSTTYADGFPMIVLLSLQATGGK